ncbi:MAG: DUF1295 domain-containing protein [Leptospiraceae bacterium]|nr:DUF1295 domain-containing protein [Leptospiraceae bacterium]MCB1199063.1 DUF1295 domain-containing protein [Leptospiraceae bacterium]
METLYWQLPLIGWATVFTFMTLLWLLHFPMKNAAIVDVGWTFSIMILAGIYAFWPGTPGNGTRNLIMFVLASMWGLRLGLYLFFTRIYKAEEEGRYVQLRKDWAPNIGFKFFIFFQAQGLLDVLLSIPFLVIVMNPATELHFIEIAGIALVFIGIVGEAIADWQLHVFKKNSTEKGQVCQKGLWNYSRHPNYFFECVVWAGWLVFASMAPYGYAAVIAPALIYYFIFRVTGVPATEEQAVRSRGEAYKEYQRTTSMFVPWFKKA